ncbi:Outer membrane protein beta-barrel domain-containing protein [Pseudarcicella hirudinis]|uniref:Outer membrane protein beta-barrel domain-containing protein n=1 Tax=Pseudarcicella hirudinis TaxID=1079859 RepID=A0A1I5QL74_9BACT|nr:porin family protein [Pseudarcicella hirudinis]SFP47019.1 Outer membrane protein beta-barrel domain-containing protein [Pseudarcicella hirudinis]
MKKVLFIVLTIIGFSATSSAQVRYGIKAGANFATITASYAGSSSSSGTLIGYHGGIVLDAPLSEKWSLQPNLLYSLKGGKSDASSTSSGGTGKLSYIELPVNAAYHITDQFLIGAGPYVGYLLSVSNDQGSSSTDGVNKIDYGVNAMVSYEITEGLVLGANYSYGLANTIDMNYINQQSGGFGSLLGDISAKNRVIGVSLTKFF